MDSVTAFNAELSGLIETKPPISKAKMGSITRGAMKAIKFYKHVVQSVEKFILKCKPEYKVPGLYVIDAIVRQSRHQFGPEKDVFAPRFAQNMQQTFANLFRCAPEDKSKIIRVLNLWLKNNVFSPEVINPLFDFFNPNRTHPMESQSMSQSMSVTNGMTSNTQITSDSPQVAQTDEQSRMSGDMSNSHGNVGQMELDPNIIRQLHHFQKLLIQQTGNDMGAGNSGQDQVKFNKKLLDFDYGDDEEEEKTSSPNVTSSSSVLEGNSLNQLLQDPNVLRQLQNLQKLKQHEMEEKQTKLTEMRLQEEAFEKHLVNVLKKLPFANECDLSRQPEQQHAPTQMYTMLQQQQMASVPESTDPDVEFTGESGKMEVITLDGNDSELSTPDRGDRYKSRRRSRSRSRDRTRDRRRRSRTRSRSRSPRSRRRSSRERAREREREKEKEYDRERRRKGLPDIKKEHLSVCSTTLWVGHLSKLVQQEELSDTFGRYGDIVSIDMIVPRGCAFIAMNRRQDAFKAMNSLKGHKMQGRAITISWATGKGVKSKEWKDYWDLDLGVSYIPWPKIDHATDLVALEEGGMFDEDTLPEWLKEKRKVESKMRPEMDFTGLDTTQPPPSAMMSMVAPFPMPAAGTRMMAPPLMPNMIPGLPLGVPPPQMMMTPMMQIPQMDKSVPPPIGSAAGGAAEHFLALNFPMPPIPMATSLATVSESKTAHDDMEIEEEEGGAGGGGGGSGSEVKKDTPLSEQLLAMSNFFNRPPPLMAQPVSPSIVQTLGQQQEKKPAEEGGREERRGRDRERSSRDRDRRDFGRDRGSRWGSGERSRERQEKDSGKSLTDRLREMASEGSEEFSRRDWRPQPLMSLFGEQATPPARRGGGGSGDGLLDGPMMMPQAPFRHQDMFDGIRHREGRVDDFERRGGPNHRGDFFPPPRFGPMNNGGMRGMMPMGGGRNGPQFGPRGAPLFMRGMRPGPPGFQFPDRPGFFEREVFDRDERRRNGPDRRGEQRRGGNSRFPGREMKQQQQRSSRWGNTSPRDRQDEGGEEGEPEDEGPPGVANDLDDDLPEVGEGGGEVMGGGGEVVAQPEAKEEAGGEDDQGMVAPEESVAPPGKATPLYDEPEENNASAEAAPVEATESAE
uniref:Putative rna polymerase ii c-terminal domain-binding protein ra4 n=1 Tax=Phlebotomus kandelakii TaxID=1109342 RepID=A0A6B2EH07_9DIPT